MSDYSISQGSFTVERRFSAPPARVFQAWSEPEQMKIWAAPAEGWNFDIDSFDFQTGGETVMRFGPPGDVPYLDMGRYDDIVPNRRIVTAYAISKGDVRISSSVSCLEFLPDAGGTRLRITEIGAYLDGHDSVEIRKGGVSQQMDQLGRYIAAV